MAAKPLVSVILPVFNAGKYLAEAVESILAQSYRPVEIIVVDDGSTDDSAEVARRFGPVRYHFQANAGAATARNQGVELAQGDFLSFLDADDIWSADKLSRQMDILADDPDLSLVFGHVQQFYSPELDEETRRKINLPQEAMPGYHVGTMLVSREDFFRVGPFETSLKMGEFIDWHAKAKEKKLKSFMMPEVVMKRRIHTNNMTTRERENQMDYVRLLKAALDRKRQQET
jgi:glycosyltransferase involved in cell wall biosynthesis